MIITFSGIDGAGKTSLTEQISKKLVKMGYNAEYSRPRYICNDFMKDFCEREFGDRYAYIPNLDQNLYIYGLTIDYLDYLNGKLRNHKGKWLICDRYLYDILAQGIHYNANIEPTLKLMNFFPLPDISFYIDIEPEVAYQRLVKRPFPPIHHLESLDNLIILKKAYEEIKTITSWQPEIIQPGWSVDEILNKILRLVNVN